MFVYNLNNDPHLPTAASEDKRLHTAEWLIELMNTFMLQIVCVHVWCTIGFSTMGLNAKPQPICSLYRDDKSLRRIGPRRGQTADKSNFPFKNTLHTYTHNPGFQQRKTSHCHHMICSKLRLKHPTAADCFCRKSACIKPWNMLPAELKTCTLAVFSHGEQPRSTLI